MIKLLIIISVLYTFSYSLTCEFGTGFKYCYDDNFKNKIEQRNAFINKKFLKKILIKIQNNKEIIINEKLTQKYQEILLEILPQSKLLFQENKKLLQDYVPYLWVYKIINEKTETELSKYGKKIFPKAIDSEISNNIFNSASVYKIVELSIIKNLTETLLFSEEELFQKKVYIEDNINKPYSDALGNIYFPKNINKFTPKEQYMIMLHEELHLLVL